MGLRKMTRQTNVLDCKPVNFLAVPHIESKLAQTWLQEFYGRHKIPMDPKATLSEYQVPVINDGYVTHDRLIFVNSFGARYLSLRMKIQHHIFPDMTTVRLNNMWH